MTRVSNQHVRAAAIVEAITQHQQDQTTWEHSRTSGRFAPSCIYLWWVMVLPTD